MTYIPAPLRRLIFTQARGCCEYCLIHQDESVIRHEVDHIYAEKHGGQTTEDNLCLCCLSCNRRKGTDFASFDPLTGEVAMLFHPRRDKWEDHFQLEEAIIQPLTPPGRVTVRVLQLNALGRVAERATLIAFGRYPPK